MIPIEEIEKNIIEFGYLIVRPVKISPSFYKLDDGTIIEALVRVDSLIQDPTEPSGYGIRISNIVRSYIPKEKKEPRGFSCLQTK